MKLDHLTGAQVTRALVHDWAYLCAMNHTALAIVTKRVKGRTRFLKIVQAIEVPIQIGG